MTDKPNFLHDSYWSSIDLDEVILDIDTGCDALWIDKHFETKGIPRPPKQGLLPVMAGDTFIGWAEPDWLPITRHNCVDVDWIAVADELAEQVLANRR